MCHDTILAAKGIKLPLYFPFVSPSYNILDRIFLDISATL